MGDLLEATSALAREDRHEENEQQPYRFIRNDLEQEGLAKKNAEDAKTQQGIAEGEATRAKEQERTAHRHLYASNMTLVDRSYEREHVARALAMLEGQRPKFGQEDLRDFEWYYLWRLCHQ